MRAARVWTWRSEGREEGERRLRAKAMGAGEGGPGGAGDNAGRASCETRWKECDVCRKKLEGVFAKLRGGR